MPDVTQSKASSQKVHVMFLTRSISFPNGMAPTQRVKLLARGLMECGLDVSVLCTQVSERPPVIENKGAIGVYEGIRFEYTTGTTVRSENFFARRWCEIRGILVAIRRLVQLKNNKKVCCIYYYGNILTNDFSRWIFYFVAQLLQLPLVTEVVERPWTLVNKGAQVAALSPLWGVQGAVVISSFLKEWAEAEKKRSHLNIKIFKLLDKI